MSFTPQTIVFKFKKFCHDALITAGILSLTFAGILYLDGISRDVFVFLFAGIALIFFGSKIIYQYEKDMEVGRYSPKK